MQLTYSFACMYMYMIYYNIYSMLYDVIVLHIYLYNFAYIVCIRYYSIRAYCK